MKKHFSNYTCVKIARLIRDQLVIKGLREEEKIHSNVKLITIYKNFYIYRFVPIYVEKNFINLSVPKITIRHFRI